MKWVVEYYATQGEWLAINTDTGEAVGCNQLHPLADLMVEQASIKTGRLRMKMRRLVVVLLKNPNEEH